MGPNVDIGERLREERERLGLTQSAFADKADVGRKSQGNYEAGERTPDAVYLAAAATLGVDVTYVVTGIRGGGVVESVTRQKRAMLDLYDTFDDDVRELVDQLVKVVRVKAGARPSPSNATPQTRGASQTFNGPVGGIVGDVVGNVRGGDIHFKTGAGKKTDKDLG